MTLWSRVRGWFARPYEPMGKPGDVSQGPDGGYYRTATTPEGVTAPFRVCEDCWTYVPRYVDFPRGLVSPESDGDGSWNRAKTREVGILDGKIGLEHLQKVVCLPCYRAAFQRVYPGAELPDLRATLMGDHERLMPATVVTDRPLTGALESV